MSDIISGQPRAVSSHDLSLDKEYVQWIYDVSSVFAVHR